MDFSTAFKVFEMNLLRQSGVTVTPQQVGLKSDPIADLQAKSGNSTFSTLLGQLSGTSSINVLGSGTTTSTASLTPPVAPTPPSDPTDATAQQEYQQKLLVYNNQMQVYNQRFMQLMLNQIQSMQQSISSSAQQAKTQSLGSQGTVGVGGILDSMADT